MYGNNGYGNGRGNFNSRGSYGNNRRSYGNDRGSNGGQRRDVVPEIPKPMKLPTDYVKVERIPLSVNKKATRVIYDFYQGHWYNKRRRNALIKKVKDTVLFWR